MRLLLELLLLASDLSGYPVPERLPVVLVVGAAEMPCLCRGAYVDGTLWVDEQADLHLPFGRSVLVHELIHHLQHHALGPARSGAARFAREVETHDVQNRYLAAQGSAARALFTHAVED